MKLPSKTLPLKFTLFIYFLITKPTRGKSSGSGPGDGALQGRPLHSVDGTQQVSQSGDPQTSSHSWHGVAPGALRVRRLQVQLPHLAPRAARDWGSPVVGFRQGGRSCSPGPGPPHPFGPVASPVATWLRHLCAKGTKVPGDQSPMFRSRVTGALVSRHTNGAHM